MNEFARQLEAVVRYSANHPAELTALMNAVYEHQDEYLPRAVLADWLDENPHYAHDPEVDIPMLRQGHDGSPLLHVLPYSLLTGKIQTSTAEEALEVKGRLVANKMQRWISSGLLSGRQQNEAVAGLYAASNAYATGDAFVRFHRNGEYDRTYHPMLAKEAAAIHSVDSMYPEPPV